MRHIFIGDIHGKVDQVKRALAMEGKKIFVGDIQDSFDRPVKDHAECYDLIIPAIRAGEAECVYGNHELSYLMGNPHRCSGYDYERKRMIDERQGDIRATFKPYIQLAPDFLVTHAGLTRQIWEAQILTQGNLGFELANGWLEPTSWVHWIGRVRGGRASVGGIFWCDFNHEFEPVPGLTQVFGHSAFGSKGTIRQVEQSFCVDCLDKAPLFLELDL